MVWPPDLTIRKCLLTIALLNMFRKNMFEKYERLGRENKVKREEKERETEVKNAKSQRTFSKQRTEKRKRAAGMINQMVSSSE